MMPVSIVVTEHYTCMHTRDCISSLDNVCLYACAVYYYIVGAACQSNMASEVNYG